MEPEADISKIDLNKTNFHPILKDIENIFGFLFCPIML
jgi:hypothetical protein